MLVPSFLRFLCIFIIYCGNDCLVQKKVTTIFYISVIKTRHILLLKSERKSCHNYFELARFKRVNCFCEFLNVMNNGFNLNGFKAILRKPSFIRKTRPKWFQEQFGKFFFFFFNAEEKQGHF